MKSINKIIFLMFFGFIVLSNNISAQVKNTVSAADTSLIKGQIADLNTNIDFLGLFLKSVGALILITVLVFAIVYFLRQLYKLKNGKGYSNNFVNIIGSTFLSPKKSIYLVEVCDRILVLGVTDSDISLLTELAKNELELDFTKIEKECRENNKLKEFPEYLSKVFGKIGMKK